jgi:hypothetical protein
MTEGSRSIDGDGDRELEAERLMREHLPRPAPPDPAWIRELASTSPAIFEALMLRQRRLETLLQNDAAVPVRDAPAPEVTLAASRIRCPYCHASVAADGDDWVACRSCLARHHQACWRESPRCASCGQGAYLQESAPSVPPARPWLWRTAAAAAVFTAASVATLLVFGGAATFTTRKWHDAADGLVTAALDERRSLDEREKLVARALADDPGCERALVLRAELARERALVANAEGDAKDAAAALASERERARSEQKLAEERAAALEAARVERARVAADARREEAEELLARAEGTQSSLEAVPLLARALAVVPEDAGDLRAKIEARKADHELALARTAVRARRTSLAGFWLQDLGALAAAPGRQEEVAAVERAIASARSGERDVEDGRLLARAQQFVAARERFERAIELGVPRSRIEADLAAVTSACRAGAEALVFEGRTFLDEARMAEAAACARDASRTDPSSADAAALVEEIDRRITSDARAEAARLSLSARDAPRALDVLEAAASDVTSPGLADALRSEKRARARLSDPELAGQGLIYFPPAPEAGGSNRACYMQRDLVTNEDFLQFVAGAGYDEIDLWDKEALPLRAGFKDVADGGGEHQGPRSWKNGSYGTADQAEKPVRGVTVHEARAYARWLSHKLRARYRLPTESEWEIAAGLDMNGPKRRVYPWGDEFQEGMVSFGKAAPGGAGTGTKLPSALGLRDAVGSVRQWVEIVRISDERIPALKGSDFACDRETAERLARIRYVEKAATSPDVELLLRTGFRLVREE